MAGVSRSSKVAAVVVALVGSLMIIAGAVTWLMVQSNLSEAKITVAEDASMLAGDQVNGPFSAYAQAQVIDKHALEATEGKTYAELERDDPLREVAMNASFLRASLFTSVVAFGVSAMAIGLGITLLLIAVALFAVSRGRERPSADEGGATAG